MPVLSGRISLVAVYGGEIVSWLWKLHFFLFCFDFVTWFCHNLNRHASLLRNVLTGNQTASFYFQVGIYSVVLSHHFARTKYIYIFRVQHTKKDSLLAKTFLFFISLHTYRKLKRVTKNEKEMVSCIAVFQINTLRKWHWLLLRKIIF